MIGSLALPSCATATMMPIWIFSPWRPRTDVQALRANCFNGSRNAQWWQGYSRLNWRCDRRTKDRSFFTNTWDIIGSFNCPATTKARSRRCGWPEIYHARVRIKAAKAKYRVFGEPFESRDVCRDVILRRQPKDLGFLSGGNARFFAGAQNDIHALLATAMSLLDRRTFGFRSHLSEPAMAIRESSSPDPCRKFFLPRVQR